MKAIGALPERSRRRLTGRAAEREHRSRARPDNGRAAIRNARSEEARLIGRRQFIRSGLALAAGLPAVAASAAPWVSGAPAVRRLRPERFVFDTRFDEAVAAARAAAAIGARTVGIEADLTRLWYDDLDLEWKRAPMTIAGVTTPQALFILETLAADRRMRVIYRGEHGLDPNERGLHRLTGPSALIDDWPSGPLWPTLGDRLMRCPAGRETAALVLETAELGSPAGRASAESLRSWIIAPRSPDLKPV